MLQQRPALFCHRPEDSLLPPSRVGTQRTHRTRKFHARLLRGNFRQALVLMPQAGGQMMRVKIQPLLGVLCRKPSTSANGDRGRNGTFGGEDPFRPMGQFRLKGLCMKVRRLAVSALAALLVLVAVDSGASIALAQLQPAQSSGQGRPPVAAPAGKAADSAPLAAPSGDVQAALVGPQSETAE